MIKKIPFRSVSDSQSYPHQRPQDLLRFLRRRRRRRRPRRCAADRVLRRRRRLRRLLRRRGRRGGEDGGEVLQLQRRQPRPRPPVLPSPAHARQVSCLRQIVTVSQPSALGVAQMENPLGLGSFIFIYSVTHLLADLGWVDLDLGCSTTLHGQ